MKKFVSSVLLLSILALLLAGCAGDNSEGKGTITFAMAGWESNEFHNAVAGRIAEEIFGYDWEETNGSTPVMHESLLSGDVDVHMEEWTDNIPEYQEDVDAGKLQELSVNFDDNFQGIYVPRYVIEGDPERGIEASAPDLKTVEDLKKYTPEIFPDDEEEGMGRMYGAISGWEADAILERKHKFLGLDENFIYFSPGSDVALQTAIINAYDKGEPVAAYYWEPTALLGKYDLVLLEDRPYIDQEAFQAGETELPAMNVTVATSNNFYEDEDNKEFIEFLSKYKTSSDLTSEGLAISAEYDNDFNKGAEEFLKKHDYLLDEWLSEEDATTMKKALGI